MNCVFIYPDTLLQFAQLHHPFPCAVFRYCQPSYTVVFSSFQAMATVINPKLLIETTSPVSFLSQRWLIW